MLEADIAEELKSQQVSNVKRIQSTRDGKRLPTNSLILTFSTPILPSSIRVGYLNVRVAVYIPNPMQCYKCFKFGHHESNCAKQTICRRCSSNHDKNETCNVPVKCANCGGEHYATSRSCPLWLKEKEILRQKHTQNISFQDARKLFESQGPKQLSYSAAVTKSVKMVDSAVQVN